MRRITVLVSKEDLAAAQALTGKGVTETVREALKHLAALHDQQRSLAPRGEVAFAITPEELKHDHS